MRRATGRSRRRALLLAGALGASAASAASEPCWTTTTIAGEGETALALSLHPRRSETAGPFFEFSAAGPVPSGDATLRVGNRTLTLRRDGDSARLEGESVNREVIDLIDYATPAQVFVSLYESGQIPAATYAFPVTGFERAVYADPKRCL